MPKKPAKNPITAEHEELFDRYLRKWQVLLSLGDWRIVKSGKPAGRSHMAEVFVDHEARLVTYRIGGDFGETPVTPESLESTALHELLHVRNHEMLRLAYRDTHYSSDVQGAEHGAISVFEGLLMKLAHYAELEGV